MNESLGFFARLWLAFILPWVLIFDGRFAAKVRALRSGAASAPAVKQPFSSAKTETRLENSRVIEAEPVAPVQLRHDDPTTALQLLAILQREGRFIDFLQEDVTSFSDAEVGGAARVVHAGCKRALADYITLEPVRREAEGAPVTLDRGFDAGRTRLTGNVVGEAPFKGKLTHHGWVVKAIQLPTLASGHDPKVIAPAEVEL